MIRAERGTVRAIDVLIDSETPVGDVLDRVEAAAEYRTATCKQYCAAGVGFAGENLTVRQLVRGGAGKVFGR